MFSGQGPRVSCPVRPSPFTPVYPRPQNSDSHPRSGFASTREAVLPEACLRRVDEASNRTSDSVFWTRAIGVTYVPVPWPTPGQSCMRSRYLLRFLAGPSAERAPARKMQMFSTAKCWANPRCDLRWAVRFFGPALPHAREPGASASHGPPHMIQSRTFSPLP